MTSKQPKGGRPAGPRPGGGEKAKIPTPGHDPGPAASSSHRAAMTESSVFAPPDAPDAGGAPDETFLRDVATYEGQLPGWRTYQGKHVLIHDGEVVAFYDSQGEALAAGFGRFGRRPFLVKRIDLDETPRPLSGVIL